MLRHDDDVTKSDGDAVERIAKFRRLCRGSATRRSSSKRSYSGLDPEALIQRHSHSISSLSSRATASSSICVNWIQVPDPKRDWGWIRSRRCGFSARCSAGTTGVSAVYFISRSVFLTLHVHEATRTGRRGSGDAGAGRAAAVPGAVLCGACRQPPLQLAAETRRMAGWTGATMTSCWGWSGKGATFHKESPGVFTRHAALRLHACMRCCDSCMHGGVSTPHAVVAQA